MTEESRQQRWNERYLNGDLPWDTGRRDGNLEQVINDYAIAPCRALDIGCGHGSNAIWLAQQGFDVDGIDISTKAIEQAIVNAAAAGVRARFSAGDVLADPLPGRGYGLVFDRGCFHSFPEPEDWPIFARIVHEALAGDGWWLSLIGSADDTERTEGPPKRSAHQVIATLEPFFEIHLLKATHFDSDQEKPARAWACLSRPRRLNQA